MCNLTDCVMNSISIVNNFSVRPMQFEGIIGRFYNNFADFITQASEIVPGCAEKEKITYIINSAGRKDNGFKIPLNNTFIINTSFI